MHLPSTYKLGVVLRKCSRCEFSCDEIINRELILPDEIAGGKSHWIIGCFCDPKQWWSLRGIGVFEYAVCECHGGCSYASFDVDSSTLDPRVIVFKESWVDCQLEPWGLGAYVNCATFPVCIGRYTRGTWTEDAVPWDTNYSWLKSVNEDSTAFVSIWSSNVDSD